MKDSTKTALYVLGGAVALGGIGAIIYYVTKKPSAPASPSAGSFELLPMAARLTPPS